MAVTAAVGEYPWTWITVQTGTVPGQKSSCGKSAADRRWDLSQVLGKRKAGTSQHGQEQILAVVESSVPESLVPAASGGTENTSLRVPMSLV